MSVVDRCRVKFLPMEVAELAFGTIMLSIMFVIAYQWNFLLAVALGAFGLMIHELGHKVVGKWRCIEDVHFVLSPIGVGLGFATSFIFGHALAAPGGVTVGDNARKHDRLLMALGGPITNFLAFALFAALHHFYPLVIEFSVGLGGQTVNVPIWMAIAAINLYLGFFNLLPLPMFDGSHIYRYNRFVWATFFISSLLVIIVYWGAIATVLGPLFQGTWSGVFGMISEAGYTKYLVPLAPGLILVHSDKVQLSNLVAHSHDEYEDL